VNLFKKPKKAAPKAKVGPQLTKIYIKDFRRGVDHLGRPLARTEIVQPGLKEPDVAEWFDLIPIPFNSPAAMANEPGVIRTPSGQPARVNAKSFTVVFRDGMAEVDQRLATFLINQERAYAKPQKPCNWSDPRFPTAEAEA
jgi:hypothetical protein